MKNYKFLIVYFLIFIILIMTLQVSIYSAKVDEEKVKVAELRKQLIEKDETIERLNEQFGVYAK